jgi:hypothetical protein
MDFLTLVRETNIASGLQGTVNSVTSVTGLQNTLVQYVKSAYIDIQNLREDWKFRRTDGSFSWYPAISEYVSATISKWTIIYYQHRTLRYKEYDAWIQDPPTSITEPNIFTIKPETNGIIINPVDQYYTINYRGIKSIDNLTTNSQVPIFHSDFHNIIVYKAAMDMALHLGNAELFNLNVSRYDVALGNLMRRELLPKKIIQRPMA